VVLAHGGRGGQGNRRFAGATRQAPRVAEPGLPGEVVEVELRLKLVVDAALLGYPNAGKSSLLRRISNATPRVADYPFTTLAPVLGTVEHADGRQLVVADVPGLLEGASEGVGLGDEFLAHLERARLLVHVIDAGEGDAEERFRAIDRELVAYGAGLAELAQIVVLNKIDLGVSSSFRIDDPRIETVVRTSAATGEGVDGLVSALFAHVAEAPARAGAPAMADYLVYRPRPAAQRRFRVLRSDRGFLVTGRDLERVSPEELEEALRAAGARAGDTVGVGERTVRLT
jgi:GTP-binding protein